MLQRSEFNWRRFDTFIFDLDGTLVDSLKQIENALDSTRINFGYEATPNGQIFRKLGLPIGELLSDLDLSPKIQEDLIIGFRRELARQISISNQLYSGAKELMSLLRAQGFKIAIATSKPTYLAKMVVKNSTISLKIDFIQGTDNFPPKPDPEVIQRCVSALNSKNPIMLGDRTEDVLAAFAAGIPAIGIAQSAHTEEMLRESGALLTFENIGMLYTHICSSLKHS